MSQDSELSTSRSMKRSLLAVASAVEVAATGSSKCGKTHQDSSPGQGKEFSEGRKGREGYPFFTYKDHSKDADPDPLIPPTLPGRVPNFPAKMHSILSRPELSDIIRWLPHGRAWCILKPREFEIKVIPTYFEHSKFSSFIRQANGWGFRRVTQGRDRNAYYHEMFLRGLPHLCKEMKRPAVSEKQASDPTQEPDFYKISALLPVPTKAEDEQAIRLNFTLEGGPKARMPVYMGSSYTSCLGLSQTSSVASVSSTPAAAAPTPKAAPPAQAPAPEPPAPQPAVAAAPQPLPAATARTVTPLQPPTQQPKQLAAPSQMAIPALAAAALSSALSSVPATSSQDQSQLLVSLLSETQRRQQQQQAAVQSVALANPQQQQLEQIIHNAISPPTQQQRQVPGVALAASLLAAGNNSGVSQVDQQHSQAALLNSLRAVNAVNQASSSVARLSALINNNPNNQAAAPQPTVPASILRNANALTGVLAALRQQQQQRPAPPQLATSNSSNPNAAALLESLVSGFASHGTVTPAAQLLQQMRCQQQAPQQSTQSPQLQTVLEFLQRRYQQQ